MSAKSRKSSARAAKRRASKAPLASYHRRRDAEQLDVYGRDIDTFISDYRRRTFAGGPPRQTLFFFPGGMACQLWRSTKKFQASDPNAKLRYERLWLDLRSFFGNALKLGMQQDGDGLFRDQHEYIVLADGAVNVGGCTPHDGLVAWCRDNNVDLFVFNWDWRRRQMECAQFFAQKFWPLFKQKVTQAKIPQAAEDFSLLGHSFGGMIVKLILENDDAEVARKLKFAITAATPFYGYGEQAHRWFEGEELLNGDGHEIRRKLVRVICSMPGLYILHYLDWKTYQRDMAELKDDADSPLKSYPSVDATTGQPFDPWDPQVAPDGRMRYPVSMGFMPHELRHALGVYQLLVKPNDDPRFFNIRGVRLADTGARADTFGSVSCGWIRPEFDPDDGTAVVNTSRVPGDNTQPAWTARLVSKANPARIRTVTGATLTHMFLMNQPGTLQELASILHGPGAKATTVIEPRAAPVFASDDELKRFLDWVEDLRARKRGALPSDEEIERDMPEAVSRSMPRLGARIIEDILKHRRVT